ncbi:Ldh family oxidoreductase [Gracilibacillus alcaliphilus]|uniref:Ldh family oxidoreductase n=1 Tax=Gracilibacillus alcaliphilus TaxID=1401441 RepID=UPI00195DE0A4|nr:Ldh family oxidoreductase [Gracilibacillus alcaliphilus]MBM7677290.1 LDH2 family malate/lactate/ureidoglycolate dehydrogenase [Gracilibacillus alcaliphilus]
MKSPNKYHYKKLAEFCETMFNRAGVHLEKAKIVAQSLVEADLRGVDSHGVVRTSIYLKRIEEKMIDPNAMISVENEAESIAVVNGGNNFGALVGDKALRVSMQKAKATGIGIVGAKHSNHFGTGAYYALRAVKEELIILVMSNASQTMPPTGGVRPFLGTNPLAVGVPCGKYDPFILDMATSVVARGKIIVADQKEEKIPLGWAVDRHGKPTTSAKEALEGAVLPLGGAKGYGISMFIDILSGVLTGAGFGKYVRNMYEDWEFPQNVGHFFITIDVNRFMDIQIFKERMDMYMDDIKSEPRADGVHEILIPGEIEKRLSEKRKKEGIELPFKVEEELRNLGLKYDLDISKASIQNVKESEGV